MATSLWTRFRGLWRGGGRLDGGDYFALGVGLMLLKYVADSAAAALCGRAWSVVNYLSWRQVSLVLSAGPADRPFYAVMLVVALPFIWLGITLTIKRLRDAGFPLWMAPLFFVQVINLVFFLVMCLVPSQRAAPEQATTGHVMEDNRRGGLGRVIPMPPGRSAALAVFGTAFFGLLLTLFDVYALGIYGLGLFVGLPFCMGMVSSVLYAYHGVRSLPGCIGVALGSILMTGAAMLGFAFEGAGCLLMATPIWAGCALLGGVVGYHIQQQTRDQREAAIIVTGLLLAIPTLMGGEFAVSPPAMEYSVSTSVDIAAPPESIWPMVIEFPKLDEPREWIFRTGLSYPIGAEIKGVGPGAVRHCNFSTGSFVEPIRVWDAPRMLRFDVTANPAPMREWMLYGDRHPPHLEGYFASSAGQFKLTPIGGGATRLEGTTWYRHSMRPAGYWRVFSDYIVHRIHLRVLEHIRDLCEAGPEN